MSPPFTRNKENPLTWSLVVHPDTGASRWTCRRSAATVVCDAGTDQHSLLASSSSSSSSSSVEAFTRAPLPAKKDGRQADHPTTTQSRSLEHYFRGLDPPFPTLTVQELSNQRAINAAKRGLTFLASLQTPAGNWACEYGGPMFLIPGYVITMYITKTPYPFGYREELIRYLRHFAHPQDGGWGLHSAGPSTVFGTALNYVALRLLGVAKNDPACIKARQHLLSRGGAVGVPAWGKFWLAMLNVYDFSGMNPIPPEMWVLPHALPIHPGRMWVHTRMVYLPMGYMYGVRFQAHLDETLLELREELYCQPYAEIHWPSCRNVIAKEDLVTPHSKLFDWANVIMEGYERIHSPWARKQSLARCLDLIEAEDINTNYLDLGPVNKVMNTLVVWLTKGSESPEFKNHVDRLQDFMWLGKDGMMMNGTNGVQLWDTAFTVQAALATGLCQEFHNPFAGMMVNALDFLDRCQIKNNPVRGNCYRQISKGAWPFSTREQSYTVSDCTAEGLKSVLAIQRGLPYSPQAISFERLADAVNVLLSMQNHDGGFASYEDIRGPFWLEWLNPAEVFSDIMTDYSYVECTTATLLGLKSFAEAYPSHRAPEIKRALKRGLAFIQRKQRPDGSWYGSWAICFTYATWFSVQCLVSIGKGSYATCPDIRRACEFLIRKQSFDGGWGECYTSCTEQIWVPNETSQVVQTAWALLTLMAADYPGVGYIRKGIRFLMSRQLTSGEWPQQAIEGVFNQSVMISYPNYRLYFPVWALGVYAQKYESDNES